jgi:hypothetical protein
LFIGLFYNPETAYLFKPVCVCDYLDEGDESMKKIVCLVLLMAIVIFMAAGCGGSGTAESGAAQASRSAEASAPAGDVLKYDGFSIAVADGWEKMDVPGGVQIYKTSGEILQVQISGENMTEEDDRAQMESLKSSYGGSAIETVRLLGIDFKKISYFASDVEQCIYTAVSGGKQIKIQATGKNYEDNGDIRAMVDSIVLK